MDFIFLILLLVLVPAAYLAGYWVGQKPFRDLVADLDNTNTPKDEA